MSHTDEPEGSSMPLPVSHRPVGPMIRLWRFRYYVLALAVVAATLFGVSRLWRDITLIEESLPLVSLHKERDFAALLFDMGRLETALGLHLATPSAEHRQALDFALDLAILRQRDNKALYSIDEHIGPLHEGLEAALGGLDAALRDAGAGGPALMPNLIEIRRLHETVKAKNDAIFQASMNQASEQRANLGGLRHSMSVMIGLFGGLGLVLVALSLSQQASIRALRQRDRDLVAAKGRAEADSRLRAAIGALQSGFIAAEDQDDRFRQLLDNCLALTGSYYGFVGVVERCPCGNCALRIAAASDGATGTVPLPTAPVSAATLTLPAGHPPIVRSLAMPIVSDGALVAVVMLANRPQGYGPEVLDYLQPLLGACGAVISASLARQAEHELLGQVEAQSEALARSNDDLETFAYAVSHDLREPLRILSGFMQCLDRRVGATLDDAARDFVRFARDGAQRMDAMILSLLEYSRVGRKGEPMDWCDSRACLDEALSFLEVARTESEADIVISGDWPQVYASTDELTRLLLNLIGNALKFRHRDTPPRISVRGETAPEFWLFTVEDDGIGVDPADLGSLFAVFKRLVAQADYPGSGVGLALCRRIVERHGGRIWAESAGRGHGTAMHFTLPRPPEDAPGAA